MYSYHLRVFDAHGNTVLATGNETPVDGKADTIRFYCLGVPYTLSLSAKSPARFVTLLRCFSAGFFRYEYPKDKITPLALTDFLSRTLELRTDICDVRAASTAFLPYSDVLLLTAFRLLLRFIQLHEPEARVFLRLIPENDAFVFSLISDRKIAAAEDGKTRFLTEYILSYVLASGGDVNVTDCGFDVRLYHYNSGDKAVYTTHSANEELLSYLSGINVVGNAVAFSRKVADLVMPLVPESPKNKKKRSDR